jgi:hypothetical protein
VVRSLRLFIAASAIARIASALQCLSGGYSQLQIALSACEAGGCKPATEAPGIDERTQS